MKYAEVTGNVTRLLAYGSPKATVAHLKSGSLNLAKEPDEVLLKKKVRFKPLNTPNTLKNSNHEIHENGESLFDAIEELKSAKATKTNITSGELNWSKINPDVFGSMFPAVIDPE